MKINPLKIACLLGILITLGLTRLSAQTTAIWTGPATGGEWNTAANWNTLLPPGDTTTNAFIGASTNVSYNLPMTATSFGSLTSFGTLNINASGFNPANVIMTLPGGSSRFFINAGGAVTTTGNFAISSNNAAALQAGSSLNVGGILIIGSDINGGNNGTGTVGCYGSFTNFGGSLTATAVNLNPRNVSLSTANANDCKLIIEGGTNNLGNFSAQRSPGGNSAPSALGADGLVISNGFVNTTSISVGNNAHGIMYLVGGTVTNSGAFTLKNSTILRPARFLQTGGLFVNSDPNLITLQPSGTGDTVYTVAGGTNVVYGISFAGAGTDYFTNSSSIYIGAGGISDNASVVVNAQLNSGGTFGAYAPWTGSSAMKLNVGTFTFRTTDQNGTPNNISITGVLSGSGNLSKVGNGTLLLSGIDTYSGSTFVNGGTLALDVNAALASQSIIVGSAGTFDVSAVGGGYVLTNTLGGSGTVAGAVTVGVGGTLNPGSNTVNATLTLGSSLTETGGAINHFDLSNTSGGPNNDFVSIVGDLNVSGTNSVLISGSLPSGATYKLFGYTGAFNGTLANFALTGAVGVLTNDTTAKTISLITLATIRGPSATVWLGNPLNTNWDASVSTNWLNAGAPDFFVPGDSVTFNNIGASNNPVNLVGTLAPASVTVNSTSNYVFAGNGGISGTTGLTKTNSGTLTILTTNSYTSATTINGGVLAASNLAIGGQPSAIGASSSDPVNLVISNGTFAYSGPSVSIDRGATLGGAATVDVVGGSTLTLGGPLVGTGGLTLVDSGTLTLSVANSYAGGTTLSGGTLTLNDPGAASGGTINFNGGTLRLTVGSQPTYNNALNVVTNSTLISAGGNNNIMGGNWTGNTNVTMNITAATGTFSVNGNMTNFLGTVEMGNSAGTFRLNAGGGNSMFGFPNSIIDLGTNTAILQSRNAGTMVIGALFGSTGTSLLGQGSGTGTLNWTLGSNTNVPNSTFWGVINDGAAANRVCSITKVGPGTLTLGGVNNYSGTTTISGGVLALVFNPTNGTDGALNNSGTINLASGTVLDVSGRSDGTLNTGGSQNLTGRGTILGALSASGLVTPGGGQGGSTGTLTVTNTVNLYGTAWMKINRANSPNSDRLVSTLAPINYGGTLVVTNIGAKLQVGDTFTLFSATSYPFSFGSLVLPNYYTWDTSQLMVNGSIKVTAVQAPPAFSSVDTSQLVNGQITLNATNGLPSGAVTVLSTTNLTLPLSSWTTANTGNFDGSGNYTISITADPAAPQQYYMLLAQ